MELSKWNPFILLMSANSKIKFLKKRSPETSLDFVLLCEDTQEEVGTLWPPKGSQKDPTMLAPWPLVSRPQNCEI
jgi:hypothetical protein